jgi:hypothetical protein
MKFSHPPARVSNAARNRPALITLLLVLTNTYLDYKTHYDSGRTKDVKWLIYII